MFFSAIIWDAAPEIFKTGTFELFGFTLGPFEVRWYGLLFATGFLIGQYILANIFKKEGKPEKDVETLTIYVVIATIVGARLGHCLFYEPETYLADPIEILKVWKGGLASHGAAFGILFALWLYVRKHKGQSYMWILDRIVILVALGGACIRFGNFVNSEIVGKPSDNFASVIFAYDGKNAISRTLEEAFNDKDLVSNVSAKPLGRDSLIQGASHKKMRYTIELEKGVDAKALKGVMSNFIDKYFSGSSRLQEHIYINPTTQQYYPDGAQIKRFHIQTWGKPRHPAQLYESVSCLILFFLLLSIYYRFGSSLPKGRIFGIFMIWIWGLRFCYEFLKENQVAFEDDLALNMGQTLSIPLTLIGIYILWKSFKKEGTKEIEK